ncbi:MAG TPA: hypothetical protein VN783_02550, partial [Thermoanaerobaculia bacterium]|nr:hypothetical protein [Thermoanaerobaculia bacterium]
FPEALGPGPSGGAGSRPSSGSLALESARIDIAAAGATARLTTRLEVVLAGGPGDGQTLSLAGLGAVVSAAGSGGAPGGPAGGVESSIEAGPDGPVLRLRGAGRREVTIESALPLAADLSAVEEQRALELRWPAAGWVTGTISGEGVERVEALSGALVVPAGPAEQNRFLLAGEPGAASRLRLLGRVAPAASAAPDEPLAVDVASASALAVSRARMRLTAYLDFEVRSGRPERLERLSVPVPAGYEVLSAAGERVADWEVTAGTLAIRLRRSAARATAIVVQLAADPAVGFDCPVLVPAEARLARAARKVAVRGNDGLIEPAGARPPSPLAADQLGRFAAGFRDAPGEALRADGTASPRFVVTWATGGDVLTGQVDRLVVDALVGETGALRYRFWAQVRNGQSTLRLGLPQGARLLAARRDGSDVTLGREGADWAVPMVVRGAAQVVDLETLVAGSFPARGGRLAIPLPHLGVPASRIEMRVAVPPGFRYALVEPGRAGRVEAPPGNGEGGGLLSLPPGFQVLEARWDGWSQEPPPLLIDVEPAAAGKEWK